MTVFFFFFFTTELFTSDMDFFVKTIFTEKLKSLATVCPIESIFKKQAVKIISNSLHNNIYQLVPRIAIFFFSFQLNFMHVWWVGVLSCLTPTEALHRNMSGTNWRESSMIQTQSSWLFYFSLSLSLSHLHMQTQRWHCTNCEVLVEFFFKIFIFVL